MTLHEALSALYRAVGERLSARIAALWPTLSTEQRELIASQTTEDGMRALLDRLEAGEPSMPVYRTILTVEVFSTQPYSSDVDLAQLARAIDSGDDIGACSVALIEQVPAELVRAHLLRIGNDGTFFDEQDDDCTTVHKGE